MTNKTKTLVSAREVMAERVKKKKKLRLKSKAQRKSSKKTIIFFKYLIYDMVETKKENDKSGTNIIKTYIKARKNRF